MKRFLRLATAVLAQLPAGLWAAAPPATIPAPAPLVLTAAQARALGVQAQVLTTAAAAASTARGDAAGARHPGTVRVPDVQQHLVAAPLPGLVQALKADEGDTVRAGAPLAVLLSPRGDELKREAQSAQAQAELADRHLARDEQLSAEGLIAQSRLETSRTAARQARLLADERQRAWTQAGGQAAGNGVLTVTAPIGGVVLERKVTLSQRVEAATPLFLVAQLNPLWVELQVPLAAVQGVQAGAAVQLDGTGLQGRVLLVGRSVDPASQTVLVRALVADPEGRLRVGQGVQARLGGGASAAAGASTAPSTALPAAALIRLDDRDLVVLEVARDERQWRGRAQPVQVLGRHGDQVQVAALPAGTRVVVQGTAGLKALLAAPPAAAPAPAQASAPPSAAAR